jgi:hypothetical protein
MVEKKLIQETISELLDANIDKDTVYSTLKDIGVSDDDIESNYNEVIKQRKEGTKEETSTVKEEEPVKEEEALKEESNEPEKDSIFSKDTEEKENIFTEDVKKKQTTKTDFVEENKNIDEEKQEEELKETTKDIEKETKKSIFDDIENDSKKNTPIEKPKNEISSSQLADVEEQVRELKAQMNGLTKIMKDILEENRNILNKIK